MKDRSNTEQTPSNDVNERTVKANAKTPLDFVVNRIDGEPVRLSTYRGDVVMIVNVASKCGLTPQYEQLQNLHEKYGDRGLSILGFPANDFMQQEPGTNAEIKSFCTTNYGVTFDMFEKIAVQGKDKCPLYGFLTSEEKNGEFGGEIKWNFTKFLVNRKGHVIARFDPQTKPDSPEIISAIESALKDQD